MITQEEQQPKTNQPPIRVLLADDHTLFRQGIAGLLASYGGLEIVGEVPNDQEALRLAQEEKPEVVIMQVQMPFERAKESLLKMREMEILLLVARGLSNHQIASTLTLSEATVKRHLANAYPKMGVASRGEAVRKALFEDWITIQDVTQQEEE